MADAVVNPAEQPEVTSRRKFLIGATSALGAVGAVGVMTPFVASWNPSAKAKAEMLSNLATLEDKLADPSSEVPQQPAYAANSARAINPEIAIMIGICTHLGCSPQFRPEVAAADLGADWLGGYFCPCHGSKFDLAGRVYKGVPAPANLIVPPHSYESDNVVIIGVDEENA